MSLRWCYALVLTVAIMNVAPLTADASEFCDDFVTPEDISLGNIGIDVRLKIENHDNDVSDFNITFLNNETKNIQRHIDYNFILKNQTDSALTDEFFNAAEATGQSILHTAEGNVTIPVKMAGEGYRMAIVTVSGINFIPVETPQDAMFPCVKAPEFSPMILLILVVPIISGLIYLSKRYPSGIGFSKS